MCYITAYSQICQAKSNSSPPLWSSSVADFNNWRVIEQKEIRLLVDVISKIDGYEDVKSWFYAAVPMLNQYAVIPQERALWVRFNCSPTVNKLQDFVGKVCDKIFRKNKDCAKTASNALS